MKVFKFGGASVSSSESIVNVGKILQLHVNQQIVVVISAMGKTTNALENVAKSFFYSQNKLQNEVEQIKQFHFNIIDKLFNGNRAKSEKTLHFFDKLDEYLQREPSENFNYEYDQIVSFGELISTSIISDYLNFIDIKNTWIDARHIIRTDNNFREGAVNWQKTEQKIQKHLGGIFSENKSSIILTQGFIAATDEYATTTLGREGSDYSAAIFAYSLNAEDVTIWKDVPGLLNADPKYFPDAVKLDFISYKEAIELAYYGATIIHPKTIKPLQNKAIPLFVKSFLNPETEGSVISEKNSDAVVPCYIFKRNQTLISISPKDFSFIAEENFSLIFGLFAHFGIKINLMQNSAISFSVCVDDKPETFNSLIEELKTKFKVRYNQNMELVTIRHYDRQTIDKVVKDRKIFTEQKNRINIQIVVQS